MVQANKRVSIFSDLKRHNQEEQAQSRQCLAKPRKAREAQKCLTHRNGRTSDFSAQWLVLLEAPDEEMLQVDKRSFVFSDLKRLDQED
jgi:predicted house-cleaning NTP pyrophosphatase (Maf/HAM1 superfamily)